jgi:hypothetical protein
VEVFLKSSRKTRISFLLQVSLVLHHVAKAFANINEGGHLAKGFVVLIALGIALVLTFLLVVAGVIAERLRKKREGYSLAPTSAFDRSGGMSRVPPEQLFSSLGQGRSGVEKQSTTI